MGHPVGMPPKKILMDGREVVNTKQLAAELGISPNAVRMLIKHSDPRVEPVEDLGVVYDRAAIAVVLEARPGRGAPGRAKPHRPRSGSAPTPPAAE